MTVCAESCSVRLRASRLRSDAGKAKRERRYQVAGSDAWQTHAPSAELRADRAVVPDLKPQVKYVFRIQALTLEGYSVFTDPSAVFRCGRRH
mmetsp:Transcript_19356/g.59601  ORF Transcript_19356/g.59601 Transcript_19356/m.59601 type:complete len:92 (-) Transcript_19356:202-477(-)